MIELRKSKPEEVPEIQELFQLCFGDTPECSGLYFDHFYRPEEFLVLREDGELRVIAGLLHVSLTEPDGKKVKAAYLYGMGTHPRYRFRGLAAQMLIYADFYLRGKRDCLITMPATAELHDFYKKFGFTEYFPLLEGEQTVRQPQGGETAQCIGGEEYDTLRERLLADRYHVSYEKLTLFQERLCSFSGGSLLALNVNGLSGCAVVERCGEAVLCKELLITPKGLEGALALVGQAFGVQRVLLRRPAFWPSGGLERLDFGMIKWYDPIAAKRWRDAREPYLGLAFD